MKQSTFLSISGIVLFTILSSQLTPTKGLLKLNNGNYLINENFVAQRGVKISLSDVNLLEKLTVRGKSKTTAIHKSIKSDWINETVYDHKTSIASHDTKIEIDNILAKYSPKKSRDNNYHINQNYLTTSSVKISLKDANQLSDMTSKGFDKTTVVHKSVYENWINETVYRHENSTTHADVKVKVEAIMKKYSFKDHIEIKVSPETNATFEVPIKVTPKQNIRFQSDEK